MTDPRAIFIVAVGAGLGGVLRLLITQFVVSRFGAGLAFYATLFINVSGSFGIGLVLEAGQTRAHFNMLWRTFFATGVLGGYTTFSTFSFEALSMFTGALTLTAILYIIASVALAILGSLAGIVAAKSLAH